VLQSVAVCCCVLLCGVVWCSVLQCVAVRCDSFIRGRWAVEVCELCGDEAGVVMQCVECVAVCCRALPCVAVRGSVL